MVSNLNAGVFLQSLCESFNTAVLRDPVPPAGATSRGAAGTNVKSATLRGSFLTDWLKAEFVFCGKKGDGGGWEKGYPWVERRRSAGGLINLLKKIKSMRGHSAGPGVPLHPTWRRRAEKKIAGSVTHDETGQTDGKHEDKDVCVLQPVTVKQRFNPRVNSIRTWCICAPPPPVRCFEWRIFPFYPSSWKGNGQFNIWWQEFNLLHW